MPINKNNKDRDRFSFQGQEADTNSKVPATGIFHTKALPPVSEQQQPKLIKPSESNTFEGGRQAKVDLETEGQNNYELGNDRNLGDESIKVETEFDNSQDKGIWQNFSIKITAVLVGSAVMLPILAVGTATYYFGNRAIERQTILAKRTNNIDLATRELAREQKLLAALLMGTGTTALLGGAIAALGTKRLLSKSQISNPQILEATDIQVYQEFIQNLSQSASQKDILNNIVDEARNYLKCDRVVVYSLNQDRYGTIVAESVALGYTQVLGQTIQDLCFEARYLEKYRDGRITAIDDIDKAQITPCYREQLEQLEVKANLVTPIINEGRLFGLLVAHQCVAPHRWKKSEIEFLYQLAKKAGLALDNAKLLDDMVSLQAQTQIEREWTHYFTNAIQHIRQSLQQDDVLDISVEEVRRVLECDRVVVYCLNQDNYGVVVAESVAAGYPRALNKTIEDPCFEARYLDKYRDGRVRAINDIYQAGMTKCYLEQLETLEVKANLVTPILNEGRLFGLLVAHQCDEPRQWQDYEIRWTTQIATQVGFALDNAKVLRASATQQSRAEKERQWTQYFTDAIQYIRQSLQQDDVLDISVEEVRRVLECDRVVVYGLNQDNYGVVVAESVAPGYPRALNKTIEDPCFEARYLDKYRDGRVRAINNIYAAGMTKCYIEQLETLEVKANLVTPILNEGRLFGLLVAHQCDEPRQWQDYEIRWMTQIATQVGFALDNATLLKRLKNDNVPTKLLNGFSLGISQDVSELELLKNSVEQARKVIKLDRVLVYQFDADWNGNIVAESVLPGYPRALNSQIKDPCFAREYAEKYRQGRTRAIANVEQANLTPCHLEQLALLKVQASLVVPILRDRQLYGLLIGHQCQEPRLWQQSEIDLFTQLGLQLGLALDRIKLQTDLDREQGDLQTKIEPQPRVQDLQQQISDLLVANQSALKDLQAKISYQSAITGDFLKRMTARKQQVDPIIADSLTQPKPQLDNDLTVAQEAISETAKKIEMLNQSNQNLCQMVNLINNIKEEPNYSSTKSVLPQLPESETIVDVDLVNLELADSNDLEIDVTAGQLVDNSESAPKMMLMNQFVGEISNLSGQISQQSTNVTDSFQKLAAFAKQLSERDDSPEKNDPLN